MQTHAESESAARRRARFLRAVVFGFAVLFVVVSYLLAVYWSH
jgi:hypothetical protein